MKHSDSRPTPEVEQIQAAIDKLTGWRGMKVPPEMSQAVVESFNHGHGDVAWAIVRLSDDSTVDALLSILQEALRQASDPRFMFPFTGYDRAATALADAILGDAS